MTWNPWAPASAPSAWRDSSASAPARAATWPRSSMHGPQPLSASRVSRTCTPACSRRASTSRASSRLTVDSVSAPSAVPVVLHAFWKPPASTRRLISLGWAPLPPLWPGSRTTMAPGTWFGGVDTTLDVVTTAVLGGAPGIVVAVVDGGGTDAAAVVGVDGGVPIGAVDDTVVVAPAPPSVSLQAASSTAPTTRSAATPITCPQRPSRPVIAADATDPALGAPARRRAPTSTGPVTPRAYARIDDLGATAPDRSRR